MFCEILHKKRGIINTMGKNLVYTPQICIEMSLRKVTTGITACGSQAFMATLLFDLSMSALPIFAKPNSLSVGLFTRQ